MAHGPQHDKKDQRRGVITTFSVHALLLLLFAFFGISYQDPPPEYGIPVNFGNSLDGSGDDAAAPEGAEQPQAPTEAVSAETEATTQDVVDAPSVSSEKPKKPVEKPVEKPAEKPVEKPKPSNELSNRLSNFGKPGGSPTGTGSGQGSTTGGGDQGAANGSKNRDGQGGSGIAGYNLSGRKPISTPAPMEGECEGEQIVIVVIRVNKDGRVIQATPGVKGSTTTSKNLLDRAQNAAMRTTWQVDPQGRELQMGSITYTFKCS
jgi:periplasmic protein TonB